MSNLLLFAGALALFLHGLDGLTKALKKLSGDAISRLLSRLTDRAWQGAMTGALVTALIQSSTATTVLTVGFVSAGLLNLRQAAGVVLGANVGTTITAQLVAFPLEELGLSLLVLGFLAKHRRWGLLAFNLGLLLFAIQLMGHAMEPYRQAPWFEAALASLHQPLLAALAGLVATAVLQSSAATTALVVALAGHGIMPLAVGVAVALGANVGTCLTAVLASLQQGRNARRVALIHVLFNLIGVAVWLPLLEQLLELALWLSPSGDVARQVANANTAFNLINTLLFLPLLGGLTRLAKKLIPDREGGQWQPLDRHLYANADVALKLTRERLGVISRSLYQEFSAGRAQLGKDESSRLLSRLDNRNRLMLSDVLDFLGGAAQLAKGREGDHSRLVRLANLMDSLRQQLMAELSQWKENRSGISSQMQAHLERLLALVERAWEGLIRAIDGEEGAIEAIRALKPELRAAEAQAYSHHASSLVASSASHQGTLRAEAQLIERLRVIYSLLRQCARVLEEAPAKA
ncbi:Na/Pi symporter [Gallaecimonas sp. GXIMD4217]|uniref:Na/Pi cotransporter family protein n=1 Tax=Gallaecimonas sp. GXIMD4217 TaxID=3131927 RepID=UPI00311B2F0F